MTFRRGRARVVLLLVALILGRPSVAGAGNIAGTSGPSAWRLTDLVLGKASIGGKDHIAYSFNLVLRNTEPGSLTLSRYEARIAYTGFLDELEASGSGYWSLPPAVEVTFPLQSLLDCGDATAWCQPPIGPTWTVVLLGADHQGKPIRQVVAFSLPPAPDKPTPPPTKVRRVSTSNRESLASLIPIQISSNLVFVNAVVEGSLVTLLLDTGAQITVLTPEVAARAGIMVGADAPRMPIVGIGAGSAPLVIVKSVGVGDYSVENLIVGVTTLPLLQTLRVDGVLGGNFMALFRMTLDRRAKGMRLELDE